MNTMLDIVGASLIGGIIFLIIMNLNIYSNEIKFASDINLKLQGNAGTIAEMLDSDLRKVGYNYTGTSILEADSNKFSFYSDIDSSGTISTVTLTISDSTESSYTTNPNNRVFYRIVNNDTSKGAAVDLDKLKFTYMNSLGAQTTVLDSIKYIKAEIWYESSAKVDSNYAKSYWEVTVNPRNI